MLIRSKRVNLPKDKVNLRKYKSGTYVYLRGIGYRNHRNQPTCKEYAIGKLDESTGMLIPNDNYFKHFDDEGNVIEETIRNNTSKGIKFEEVEVISIGLHLFSSRIFRELGLDKILFDVFGQQSEDLMSIAEFMVSNGNVMEEIENYHETHVSYGRKFDGPSSSRFFSKLTKRKMEHFFDEWTKHNSYNDTFAFDVTSISSYAKNIGGIEDGYNRDKEYLPQLNMGLMMGIRSGLPMSYVTYEGSIPDKTKFENIIEMSKRYGDCLKMIIIDQGFKTKSNMKFLNKNKIKYITPVDTNPSKVKDILVAVSDELLFYKNDISFDSDVRGMIVESSEKDAIWHAYQSTAIAILERQAISKHVKNLDSSLTSMKNLKKVNLAKYQKFFQIGDGPEVPNDMEWELKKDDYLKEMKCVGTFILETNEDRLDSEQTLLLYRMRQNVEAMFDEFKNEIDFKRLKTHNDDTTNGKIFCGFLALILRNYLEMLKKERGTINSLSCRNIFNQLSQIQVIKFPDRKKIIKTLTKKQKDILRALDINFEDENLIQIFNGI